MNYFTCILYWVSTVSLAQITLASKEEYLEKINQIKSQPAIQQFLKEHKDSITQYGILQEKLRGIFIHILRTRDGKETLTHLWTEMEIIMGDKNVHALIRTILSTSEHIMTSKQGPQNLIALAEYIKSLLTVRTLFSLMVSAKRFMVYLFLSQDGLKGSILMKESAKKWEENPNYPAMEKVINEDLLLLRPLMN